MKVTHLYVCLLILLGLSACKERFVPELPVVATGYLVLEGLVNTGAGETQIKLSRTVPLTTQTRNPNPELKAQVQLEAENNRIIPLPEKGLGVYGASNLNLEHSARYRLRIKTARGQEYLSDFAQAKKTPAIDNLDWEEKNNGVQLYVNAHDSQNNTRYYFWEYEETWEYVSPEITNLKFDGTRVEPRTPAEQVYRCWGQSGSTSLILGSSAKLTQDIIYQQPLVFIPPGSIKLNQRYSILVKQYALTRQAYDFLQTMRRNTETMGSFFDAQPSEIKGNIRSVTNPAEPVIGFFSLSDVVEKRIFISRTELVRWKDTVFECVFYAVPNHPDSMKWYFEGKAPVPYPQYRDEMGGLKDQTKPCCLYVPQENVNGQWQSANAVCADCTTRGGKNVKPGFWP